ncbi:MAG: phosphoheptose isomerase, partial [Bacillota bacterium]|nr:phosphoheptose isomerase [Bacillota bacterium]
MSFMFSPYPYDDLAAINRIAVPDRLVSEITCSTQETCDRLAAHIDKQIGETGRITIGIEPYLSAPVDTLTEKLAQACYKLGHSVTIRGTESLFIDSTILEQKLHPYLPEDRETDPVLLFGSLFDGGYEA